MAVAVTAGDRYGSGQSSLLVTRPLVARPALPRFLRAGDRFAAGVVVNRRDGAAARGQGHGRGAQGAELKGTRTRTADARAGRGREVRFDFQRRAPADSAPFRFDATSGPNADAVRARAAAQPAYPPAVLHGRRRAARHAPRRSSLLPADIDPERSTLRSASGTSPLAMIRGA